MAQTAEMFKEIAKQLEALLKEEAPQQIAEARELAKQLAKAEREFAEKFQGALNPVQATSGGGKVDPKSQIKPMMDPDMKPMGSGGKTQAEGQNGSGGKGREKDKDGKNQEPSTKNPKEEGAAKDDPDGKSGGDKPMPDGQGGAVEDKEGDEKQSGGGGSQKEGKDKKPGDDQDGSGGDKSKDKQREGSGDGSEDERMNDKGRNGRGKPLTAEQLRELAAARADQLAERGKTLQDVLNAIAQSTDPNDKEAVAKIQAITKEIDINKLVGEMGRVSNMIRSKQDGDAKLSSLDAAERLEIMAQRLDGAYRGIVAPQAEELRKLEQAMADLRDQLEKLETPSQVAAWHREARELLDKLDKLGVNLKAREELENEMKQAGFGITDSVRRDVTWGLIDGRYDAPVGYSNAIIHLQEDVQERIQTLILGDLGNVSDDATPPKYQEFVERYYEVLSRQGGKAGKPEASSTRGKQKTSVRKP